MEIWEIELSCHYIAILTHKLPHFKKKELISFLSKCVGDTLLPSPNCPSRPKECEVR